MVSPNIRSTDKLLDAISFSQLGYSIIMLWIAVVPAQHSWEIECGKQLQPHEWGAHNLLKELSHGKCRGSDDNGWTKEHRQQYMDAAGKNAASYEAQVQYDACKCVCGVYKAS